jgi:hypothetical protein
MISREQRHIGTIGYLGGIMSLPEPFTWSWGNLVAYSEEALCSEGQHIHWDRTSLSLHDYARNDLLTRMRGDWILMLDTDVAFEPDFAARLVRTMMAHNVDVLTGIYSFKKPPHFPVLYVFNQKTERHEIVADWDREADLIETHSAGAGCLLVKRHVFERITSELKENPFDRFPGKGEDHSFFMRLRKLGIKAYCAPKIELQHLAYWGIQPSVDYKPPATLDHQYDLEAMQNAPALAVGERTAPQWQ